MTDDLVEKRLAMLEKRLAMLSSSILYHFCCIERALEDAQSCLLGETPETAGTHEEAECDALDLLRAALIEHLPELKKAFVADGDKR